MAPCLSVRFRARCTPDSLNPRAARRFKIVWQWSVAFPITRAQFGLRDTRPVALRSCRCRRVVVCSPLGVGVYQIVRLRQGWAFRAYPVAMDNTRRFAAEFLGTGLLVFAGVGSAIF